MLNILCIQKKYFMDLSKIYLAKTLIFLPTIQTFFLNFFKFKHQSFNSDVRFKKLMEKFEKKMFLMLRLKRFDT